MRAFLIFNPHAGGIIRGGTHRIPRAAAILRERGLEVVETPTEGPNHATELARQCLTRRADLIIAAGGDGTINEVANGMIGSQVPLAILPAGTANVLANELLIGNRIRKAAAAIPEMVPTRIAVGRFTPEGGEPRHFLLMAGVGMDADIVSRVQPGVKRRWGKLAYWFAGLAQIGRRLPQFEANLHGRKFATGFLLAARVRNYGGDLEIVRNVRITDSNFEIAVFEGRTTWPYAKYMAGVATGTLAGMSGVTLMRTCCADLAPIDRPIYVQLDGELAGEVPGRIEIVPDALTLMTPPGLARRYGQPDA